jgi:hypothetical protein
MKKLLATLFVSALLFPAAVFAQNPPKETEKPKDAKTDKIDITGVWDTIIESPEGTFNVTTTFKQEGEKVTGTQASQAAGEVAVEGTLTGADLKFGITIDWDGQAMPIAFTGKVEGDSISGSCDFGGMASGTWSAKRQKK